MNGKYFLKTRQKIAKWLIRILYKVGGINPLSNAHLDIGVLYSDVHMNGEDEVLIHLGQINPSPTIFDVGANIGEYAQLIKKDIPKARVFSFEPNPYAFEKLSKLEGICAINKGMGSRNDVLKLYMPSGKNESSHATIIADAFDNKYELDNAEIQISTIKNFCLEKKITQIDFLKIDTEGYEMEVMKGAEEILQTIPFIQFEMNYHFIYTRTFLRDFYELLPDHDFFRITKKGLTALGAYEPINEIFRMQNILAISKDKIGLWQVLIKSY